MQQDRCARLDRSHLGAALELGQLGPDRPDLVGAGGEGEYGVCEPGLCRQGLELPSLLDALLIGERDRQNLLDGRAPEAAGTERCTTAEDDEAAGVLVHELYDPGELFRREAIRGDVPEHDDVIVL